MIQTSVMYKKNNIDEYWDISLASGSIHTPIQSLIDFLQQYLSEKLLDSMEAGELANLQQLLCRLDGDLTVTMRKKGVEAPPPPSMETIEAAAILTALDFYQGNVTMAAKALGIGRNTLYRKMKQIKRQNDQAVNEILVGRNHLLR